MDVRMSMSSSGLICARCPRRRRAGLSCRMSEVAAGCAPGRTASRSADGQQRARAAHRRPQRLHGCQHPARCPPFWSLGREHVPATRRARCSSAEHLASKGLQCGGPERSSAMLPCRAQALGGPDYTVHPPALGRRRPAAHLRAPTSETGGRMSSCRPWRGQRLRSSLATGGPLGCPIRRGRQRWCCHP